MNHQMTTAMQLKAGTVPVNSETKIETVVIVDANGVNLQSVLDDHEARITTLEP